MRRHLTALILMVLLAGTAARADQRDPRLDLLFGKLRMTEDSAVARTLAHRIWAVWLNSGREDVNRLMTNGQRAMASGNPRAALQQLDIVVKRAPKFAEGWNKRATLLYILGEYKRSIADVERTLALEPRHFGALSGLGLINLRLGRERAALEAFEKALAINPHLPLARARVIELRRKLGGKPI